MPKLCIVLSSSYSPLDEKGYRAQIDLDSATISETLTDHVILSIDIDVMLSSEKYIQGMIMRELKDLARFTECHIVLNSHGTTVNKDIQDAAVKQVIELVSAQNIKIKQISALICHAMALETAADKMERLKSSGKFGHVAAESENKMSVAKKTTMQILADKIMKMGLLNAQNFVICGPTCAYDPVSDKSLVQKILLGESDPSIAVLPVMIRPKNTDFAKIRSAIAFLRDYDASKVEFKLTFGQMTSLIGQVTAEMQHALSADVVQSGLHAPAISQALLSLYQAITATTDTRMDWQARFRTWAKANKPASEARLIIVENYINTLETVAVSSGSFFLAGAGAASIATKSESDCRFDA